MIRAKHPSGTFHTPKRKQRKQRIFGEFAGVPTGTRLSKQFEGIVFHGIIHSFWEADGKTFAAVVYEDGDHEDFSSEELKGETFFSSVFAKYGASNQLMGPVMPTIVILTFFWFPDKSIHLQAGGTFDAHTLPEGSPFSSHKRRRLLGGD
jgi:hypothetical protein